MAETTKSRNLFNSMVFIMMRDTKDFYLNAPIEKYCIPQNC